VVGPTPSPLWPALRHLTNAARAPATYQPGSHPFSPHSTNTLLLQLTLVNKIILKCTAVFKRTQVGLLSVYMPVYRAKKTCKLVWAPCSIVQYVQCCDLCGMIALKKGFLTDACSGRSSQTALLQNGLKSLIFLKCRRNERVVKLLLLQSRAHMNQRCCGDGAWTRREGACVPVPGDIFFNF